MTTAVARLYESHPSSGEWTYTGKWGAVALVAEEGSHYIKLVDLAAQTVAWQEELYGPHFEYATPAAFFHTFEGEFS